MYYRTLTAIATAATLALATPPPISAQEASAVKVNVNTATAEQLAYLPGIGEKTADNILYAREQGWAASKCSDLEAISGIGPATSKKACPFVSFKGETTATSKQGGKAGTKAGTKKFKRPDPDSGR